MMTTVGAIAEFGVMMNRKLCEPLAGISLGALTFPLGSLVAGLVIWKVKSASSPAGSARKQSRACPPPVLITVATAPMVTVRLLGNTDASRFAGEKRVKSAGSGPISSPGAMS